MKKPPEKKPFYLHWFTVEPFGRIVFLVVGDVHAALRYAKRHKFRRYDFGEITSVIDGCDPIDQKGAKLDECGRTIYRKSGDALCYFAVFPTPGTLVHELFHATCHIMEVVGVADKNGETDAYILGNMTDHFFSVLEKDKTIPAIPPGKPTRRTTNEH